MGPISPIAIDRPRSSCAGRCRACAARTGRYSGSLRLVCSDPESPFSRPYVSQALPGTTGCGATAPVVCLSTTAAAAAAGYASRNAQGPHSLPVRSPLDCHQPRTAVRAFRRLSGAARLSPPLRQPRAVGYGPDGYEAEAVWDTRVRTRREEFWPWLSYRFYGRKSPRGIPFHVLPSFCARYCRHPHVVGPWTTVNGRKPSEYWTLGNRTIDRIAVGRLGTSPPNSTRQTAFTYGSRRSATTPPLTRWIDAVAEPR